MTDPSMNTEQTYCWNTEVAQQDAKYYPIPQMSNFPNYTQPSNYNSSYSYNIPSNVSNIPPSNVCVSNIPPPNVSSIPPLNISNIPPPNVSNIPLPNVSNIPPDVNSTNSLYHFQSTTYHNEATNFPNNIPYQNQMDPQCSDQYYGRMNSAHKQYMSENYAHWNMKSKNAYNDSAGNEWHSNRSSASWTTYQNTSAPWYDTSVTTYDKERLCPTQMYEESQGTKELNWKYDNRKTLPKHTVRKQGSSSHSKPEKVYRSQFEDHRDRYRQHSRETSSSRDSTYDSRHFERSSSKKHGSSTSHSEGSYVSNGRKRSKSRESHSIRETTPTNNSKRTKGPTEREILLEKYR